MILKEASKGPALEQYSASLKVLKPLQIRSLRRTTRSKFFEFPVGKEVQLKITP